MAVLYLWLHGRPPLLLHPTNTPPPPHPYFTACIADGQHQRLPAARSNNDSLARPLTTKDDQLPGVCVITAGGIINSSVIMTSV